jgi:hypothetical protein
MGSRPAALEELTLERRRRRIDMKLETPAPRKSRWLPRISAPLPAIVGLLLLAPGCGDDKTTDPGTTLENNLVFTRADTTRIAFGNGRFFVWCGPWEEGAIDTASIQIVFASTEPDPNSPYWWLRVVAADVVLGEEIAFPNTFVFDVPRNADLFLSDPPNELSSATEESSGGITFQRLDCGEEGAVEFTIDAVLGSEYSDQPPVRIQGSFRAPVGDAPSKLLPIRRPRG